MDSHGFMYYKRGEVWSGGELEGSGEGEGGREGKARASEKVGVRKV